MRKGILQRLTSSDRVLLASTLAVCVISVVFSIAIIYNMSSLNRISHTIFEYSGETSTSEEAEDATSGYTLEGMGYYIDESQQLTGLAISFSIALSVLLILVSLFSFRVVSKRKDILREKETVLSLLGENIDDEVVVFYGSNPDDLYFVSTNAIRTFGISADEFKVNPQRFYGNLDEKLRTEFRSLAGASDTVDIEGAYRDSQLGIEKWITLHIQRLHSEKKTSISHILVIRDQTKSKHDEQALRDALVAAQQAGNSKQIFLSRMSHEIRTPLNAIIGMLTIALSRPGDQEHVEQCLNKIGIASKHLLTLVNSILDMSKIDSGKMSLSSKQFSLPEIVEGLTALFYPQAVKRGLAFDVTVSGTTDEYLIGDPLRLNQIFLNLLSNALKFTPEGGSVKLTISQRRRTATETYLEFVVTDTGIGMTPEGLERIFTPFEQADESISREFGGTGLGMPITKNLISLMGGTIGVESELGRGTKFTVCLPFELLGRSEELSDRHTFEGLKALVVDDDRSTCDHVSIILNGFGIVSNRATSGAEAIDLIVEGEKIYAPYDICIIDWKMPGMDGVETTRNIRAHVGPDTLVIIMSAYDWHEIETEAREAGADSFISKPFFPSTVYKTLREINDPKPANEINDESETVDFRGRHFLIVEDNEINREILAELIKLTGATAETATNGKEAVDLFEVSEPERYDAILMDVRMAIMTGHEATRLIRKSAHPDAKRVPIIAMTANAFDEDIAASLECGMNVHVAKPIDSKALWTTLQRYFVESVEESTPTERVTR